MSDIIRTVIRLGDYYTRAKPFRESDPNGWEARVVTGERVKASVRNRVPQPVVAASALPCANGDGGKVVKMRKRRA